MRVGLPARGELSVEVEIEVVGVRARAGSPTRQEGLELVVPDRAERVVAAPSELEVRQPAATPPAEAEAEAPEAQVRRAAAVAALLEGHPRVVLVARCPSSASS